MLVKLSELVLKSAVYGDASYTDALLRHCIHSKNPVTAFTRNTADNVISLLVDRINSTHDTIDISAIPTTAYYPLVPIIIKVNKTVKVNIRPTYATISVDNVIVSTLTSSQLSDSALESFVNSLTEHLQS